MPALLVKDSNWPRSVTF